MAGGTWSSQTKSLPGVYTNYKAAIRNNNSGVAGVVALALAFPWFAPHKLTTITSDTADSFVKSYGAAALAVREALKKASKVLMYRLNSTDSTAAKATITNLVCTAKYPGTYGNCITVAVESAAETTKYYVLTYLDGNEMDSQLVGDIAELVDNEWVKFTAAADDNTLTASAGAPLTGGTDGTVTQADHIAFLSALELEKFNTIACISDDSDVKKLYDAYTKRMLKEEGKYFQSVIPDCAADFEGIISVQNGIILSDGTKIDKTIAAAYVAGASASAQPSSSLTAYEYTGAVDVDTRYTLRQQEAYAQTGQMIFVPESDGKVYIQKDINTLVNLTDARSYAFTKNKVIRTLFSVIEKITEIGRTEFIGKMQNTADSRELFKSRIYSYLRELKAKNVLSEISTDDITVKVGNKLDSIVVDFVIRPVDTIDIIYNTITIDG